MYAFVPLSCCVNVYLDWHCRVLLKDMQKHVGYFKSCDLLLGLLNFLPASYSSLTSSHLLVSTCVVTRNVTVLDNQSRRLNVRKQVGHNKVFRMYHMTNCRRKYYRYWMHFFSECIMVRSRWNVILLFISPVSLQVSTQIWLLLGHSEPSPMS